MKVYLVRHGETDWNKSGRMQGRMEVDLNLFGFKQSHLCAKRLKPIPFEMAFTSPQSRALQTAELILKHHNVHLETNPALQEIHLGKWEGMTWSEVKRQHRGLIDDMTKDRQTAKLHGGEAYEDVLKRAMSFIETISKLPFEHVLVVSHGGLIKMVLSYVLDLPIEKRGNFHLSNTGISVIEKDASSNKWRVISINETSHLEEMFFE